MNGTPISVLTADRDSYCHRSKIKTSLDQRLTGANVLEQDDNGSIIWRSAVETKIKVPLYLDLLKIRSLLSF